MNKRVIDQPDPYKLGLEPVLRLLAVDELYKHKIDHHSSSLLYQKKQSLQEESTPCDEAGLQVSEETDPETRGAPETIRTRVSARSRAVLSSAPASRAEAAQVSSPDARRHMATPELRDPSQFPVESFFEIDERNGCPYRQNK